MSSADLLLGLLGAALKAAVLLLLAAGLVLALRRAPARTRHGIWAGALAGALLVPLLSPWVPAWSIAALPRPVGSGERPEALEAPSPGPAALSPKAAATPTASRGLGLETSSSEVRRPGRTSGDGSPGLGSRIAGVSAATWLLGVWVLGSLVSLAGLLRAILSARRLERSAAEAAGAWPAELEEAQRRVGVRRPVRLLASDEVARPMTWGWRRPVILLPAGPDWGRQRRRIVLRHELVHVRRADWLVRVAARLVGSVYWFHPLVWVAARRLALEQEIACDEEVVALGTRPSSYAGHLLAIARSLGHPAPAHALDMARRSQMEGRLMSILEGRRLRGSRKLATFALALIAGLVPALAAIEPWGDEQQLPETEEIERTTTPIPGADTAGVARVLGELEALEQRMEPFEAELEGLEAEMEPLERELEGLEVEMGPVEVELEGIEAELEPFEAQLEAVEAEMEPFEVRLEAIEAELEPFEAQLEGVEVEMRPFEALLEAIEEELEPFEARLEAIEEELEPLARELEELSEQLEPLAETGGEGSAEMERLTAVMREVRQLMAPLHERMGAVHEEMRPIYERLQATHQEMQPLHQRMGAVHEEMRPIYERLQTAHREMEPLFDRLSVIHQQMKPVYERMGATHERMAPYRQRMGERHERMEPHFRRMGEVHERMRPLYEEMGQRHRELERELIGVVERMLARELEEVTARGTDYAPAAERVMGAVSLRVDDGTLRVMSSAARVREVLGESLGAARTGTEQQFAAAVERFVRALGELEVEAQK